MATKPRNKFELKLYKQIEDSGTPFGYETEKLPYEYVVSGNYKPDYFLRKRKIYIEAKGYFRPDAMKKMIAVKAMHPDLDIRFVFYRKDKKYIKFAEKYGFPYAIGTIPEEWLNEV